MSKWCVNDAFSKAIQRPHVPTQSPSTLRRYDQNEAIPVETWEDTLIRAARLVERLGPQYLPIFERVEKELEKARNRLTKLEKVRRIADGDYVLINKSLREQSDFFEP